MPESVEKVASGAAHGMFEGIGEFVDVILDIVVPILAAIAGFLLASAVGLGALFHNLFFFAQIPNFSGTQAESIVDGLLASAIWGGAALSLWRASHHDGMGFRWVVRSFATFFGGMSIRELVNGLTSSTFNEGGLLGNLAYELGAGIESQVPGAGQ